MSVDARVSRPRAGADRVRPARVLAAALAGLGCGVALVWFVARDEASAAGEDARPAAEAPPTSPDAGFEATRPPPEDAATTAAARGAAGADAGAVRIPATAARDAGSRLAAAPSAPPPSTTQADAGAPAASTVDARAIELGTVAYLRCDGLELGGGRFPCPRDRALEDAGWTALETLARCREDPGAGALEVRIELAGHDVTGVRYRPIDDAAIDLSAADRCLRPALEALRTELAPERMIVSFRAVLR